MPLVVRILHRILAKRLGAVKDHAFQAGFVEGRSTSENIWLLNAVLGSAGTSGTSTYASLLDFKKAFDSVSHNTLIGILQDLGLPPRLVGYIQMVSTHTLLTLGDNWFQQGRGVLQRNPLSPHLFNILIDYILAGLAGDIGVSVWGHKVGAIAYTDDIVIRVLSSGLVACFTTVYGKSTGHRTYAWGAEVCNRTLEVAWKSKESSVGQ